MQLGEIVGLVGGICGITSVIYTVRQTRLLQKQVDAALAKDASYGEWAKKWEQAVEALTKICAKTISIDNVPQHGLRIVFPGKQLHKRINRYLGRTTFLGKFEPAKPSQEQLLNPVVQQLIQEVLDTIEKFKQEHTDWARVLELLPPL